VDAVPGVKFADLDDHGYAIVDVTRTRSLRVAVHRYLREPRPASTSGRPGRSGAAILAVT
jgi:hypothetical protein